MKYNLRKINIYFQNSTHISHNIPESQNLFHNICRVRYSVLNKTNHIVLASKLWDLYTIPFGKKKFSVEANYQRKYKQTPLSLYVCRASLSDFYASGYPKILRGCSLNCIDSYQNKNNVKKSNFHLRIPFKGILEIWTLE